jgi:protein-S-isoprenylcysteine O-methyltransferase Ste14
LKTHDGHRKSDELAVPPAADDADRGKPSKSAQKLVISAVSWGGALLFVIALAWFLYAYLVRFGRPAPPGTIGRAVLIDAALFVLFAVHHSLFARSGLKAWMRRMALPDLERSLYTWVSSALFLLVCRAWQPVAGVLYGLDGWAAALGYAAQVLGIALAIRGSSAIDVLDLAGVRQVLNARRGSVPAHVPLETRGLYGLVRHPIYLGWALFVFGAPHMTATRFLFATLSTGYLVLAIPWEERRLTAVFGDEYRAYQRTVRWRMVPGVY